MYVVILEDKTTFDGCLGQRDCNARCEYNPKSSCWITCDAPAYRLKSIQDSNNKHLMPSPADPRYRTQRISQTCSSLRHTGVAHSNTVCPPLAPSPWQTSLRQPGYQSRTIDWPSALRPGLTTRLPFSRT